ASSQASTRAVSQRARMSTFRLTRPASPAGMQAATATAKAIAVISLSAVIALLASQRSSTSTTVTPATISMPSTPTKAIGRVSTTHWCSSRSAGDNNASRGARSVMRCATASQTRCDPRLEVGAEGAGRSLALGGDLGAERRQNLGAVGHRLRPFRRHRGDALPPLGLLLRAERDGRVLHQVARLLPLLLGLLAELA